MDETPRRPGPGPGAVVVGTVSRVELCPCAGSVVLSLGALSLRLDFAVAEDLAATMTRAMALLRPEGSN
jgi:hypothetical protein